MDDETREYLDGRWFWHAKESDPLEIVICGNDGDPIVTCCWHNAAHFLTPVAVAEYLMGLHDEHRVRSAPRTRQGETRAEPPVSCGDGDDIPGRDRGTGPERGESDEPSES